MQKWYLLKLLKESGEGRWLRIIEEVNSFMIYLIHCKNMCICQNIPLPITTIKAKIKKNRNEEEGILNAKVDWMASL
jgi:hypothetical protein